MLAFSGIENTPIDNTDTDRTTATDNMGAVTEEEGSLVLPDGTSLYTKSWRVCHFLSIVNLGHVTENALMIARGDPPSNSCLLPWI